MLRWIRPIRCFLGLHNEYIWVEESEPFIPHVPNFELRCNHCNRRKDKFYNYGRHKIQDNKIVPKHD